MRQICVGHEWSFGKNRAGNLDLLQKLGAKDNFEVVGIKPVRVNENVVSSTAIRNAIQEGNFQRAAEMLGRDYTILGTVVHGQAIGNSLGFPTANLSAHSEQFPPNGVYLAEASLDGSSFEGVINLGVRPTVARGIPERTLEIHLLDFKGDIYGKDLEVRFDRFLRPEMKFGNADELRDQIRKDVENACAIIASRDR